MSHSLMTQGPQPGEDSAEEQSPRRCRPVSPHERSIPHWLRHPPDFILVAVLYLLVVSIYLYVVAPLYELELTSSWARVILGSCDRLSGKRLLLEKPAKGPDSLILVENKVP